jgi:hypothetical protein
MEQDPLHPLIQKTDPKRIHKQVTLIVDGSLKIMFEKCFVENQATKASKKI